MTSYNTYPTILSAPENPQVAYHLSTIQNKQQGLLKLEESIRRNTKSTLRYWID